MWSLGLLVYECATGASPYPFVNHFEILEAISDGEPPKLPAGAFSNEVCVHVHVCARCAHICKNAGWRMCVCLCICIFVHVHVYIYIYIYIHAYKYT